MGSSEPLALVQLPGGLLGGSWVVISRVISPLIGVIIIVTLLITPLITTHEPPSLLYKPWDQGSSGFGLLAV